MRRPFFYGWIVLGAGAVCYGFGISPAYYGWGALAPGVAGDLGLDRGEVGGVFGLFNVLHQSVGLLVGIAVARLGLRPVMAAGSVVTALGMLHLAGAESVLDCYVGFSLLAGLGVGCSTLVPCQTLAQNWFLRRRALALGVTLTAGAVVGAVVPPAAAAIGDWREAWRVGAVVAAALAVVAVLLVRDTPEQVGQVRDGAAPEGTSGEAPPPGTTPSRSDRFRQRCEKSPGEAPPGTDAREWRATHAVRTRQFALLLGCSVAYSVTWSALAAHLPLHLDDAGYARPAAVAVVSVMILCSSGGRLLGAAGDWLPPQRVLAVALALEGFGAGLVLTAGRAGVVWVAAALVGLGFGVAYTSVPVVLAHFFGRRAFAVTAGLRLTVTGAVASLGPWLSGELFDATGAYTLSFAGLAVLSLGGAACAAALRHPGAPRARPA